MVDTHSDFVSEQAFFSLLSRLDEADRRIVVDFIEWHFGDQTTILRSHRARRKLRRFHTLVTTMGSSGEISLIKRVENSSERGATQEIWEPEIAHGLDFLKWMADILRPFLPVRKEVGYEELLRQFRVMGIPHLHEGSIFAFVEEAHESATNTLFEGGDKLRASAARSREKRKRRGFSPLRWLLTWGGIFDPNKDRS